MRLYRTEYGKTYKMYCGENSENPAAAIVCLTWSLAEKTG